jgi:HK97 family phage major capsid protein
MRGDKMNANDLRGQYAAKVSEAKKIASEWIGREAEMPVDVADKITRILGEADTIRARLDAAEQLKASEEYLNSPMPPKVSWRGAGPGEGDVDVDPKSWRSFKVAINGEEREVRYQVPLAVQKKGYSAAFEAYLRYGKAGIGPNDLKTLTEGADSAGGFLVPEDFQAELLKKIAAQAVIRANARVVQTSRDIVTWPRVNYTSDNKYTSGVRLTWTGEIPASATAHRVTEPIFGAVQIPVHTAMASIPLSNDLIEDSAFDVVGLSSSLLSEAFSVGEDDVFINGTGAGQPMGILAQVSTSAEGTAPAYVVSGSASSLTANGLIDLAFSLPDQYDRNAKWYLNKSTEKVIRKLVGTTSGDYLFPTAQAGLNQRTAPELLGYPIVRCVHVPDVAANAYPIIFGDLSGYIIVDRVGLSIQRLSELYAETNITLLLARKRVGGYCAEPYRIRVQKVST